MEIAKHNGTHISSIDIKLSTKRSYSMQFAWKSLLGNMLFEGEVNEVGTGYERGSERGHKVLKARTPQINSEKHLSLGDSRTRLF